jgi:hypothetical protein
VGKGDGHDREFVADQEFVTGQDWHFGKTEIARHRSTPFEGDRPSRELPIMRLFRHSPHDVSAGEESRTWTIAYVVASIEHLPRKPAMKQLILLIVAIVDLSMGNPALLS